MNPPPGHLGPHLRLRQLAAAQRGDRAAEELIVRSFEPLVQRVVRQVRVPADCERDDLAQEARIGLVLAIRHWRPDRGPFPAYADRCVRNRALKALDTACSRKHRVLSFAHSLYDSPPAARRGGPDDRPGQLIDMLPAPPRSGADPEAGLLVREDLRAVVSAVPMLTGRERTALVASLDDYRGADATSSGSPGRRAVHKAAYRARRKLAAVLADAA